MFIDVVKINRLKNKLLIKIGAPYIRDTFTLTIAQTSYSAYNSTLIS